MLTHIHQEIMHAQWAVLLDNDFLCSYVHGLVITCSDGVQRWFYPRIFTYLADYPEKQIDFICIHCNC